MEHVLIVGGTRGMGYSTAERLLAEGYRVTITGRSAQSVEDSTSKLPHPQLGGMVLELTDERHIAERIASLGALDHIVLAGSSDPAIGTLADLSMPGLLLSLQVKVLGYLSVVQAALPKMAQAGSVTFIGGLPAQRPMPGTVGLAVVHGALDNATRTLAKELAPRRVNLISPGFIQTHALDALSAADIEQMLAGSGTPMQVGRPEQIAHGVHALIGNTFISGIVMNIDGGAHLG